MRDPWLVVAAAQVLRIALPYVLAATGGTFSERSGVINIALEGMMLSGAFGFVLGTHALGNPALGLVAGVVAGLALAALLALVTLRFRADAVVAGVAVNLLALGGTKFLLKLVWNSSSNSGRVDSFAPLVQTGGSSEGLAGVLTNPLFLLAVVLLAAAPVLLFRTRLGLRLRACGEHPEAAATLGIPVLRMRLTGVLLSGLFAALAGVWLAAGQHQFTDGMSAGRGYIALAAMIVAQWRPLRAAAIGLLFGVAEVVQIALQGAGYEVPPQFLQMLPYAVTLAVLVATAGRAKPPAALGKTYEG